jgi:hypothetical protein
MKLAPLFLVAALTSGCAGKKLVAKNADLLIELQIEKRLPLYSSQKDRLAKDVKEFLNNQKPLTKKSLPLISKIELNPEKVDEQYDTLNGLYQKLALQFSKLMGKYMAMLDSKQQKEFKENLEVENRALKRMDSDDQLEKTQDRIESLLGTITDKQIKLIKEQKSYFEARHKVRLSRRESLHEEFAKIYKMDLSDESRAVSFYDAFAKYQSSYPENPKNKELIKKLLFTLNADQKAVFTNKIKELKEILNYYLETSY